MHSLGQSSATAPVPSWFNLTRLDTRVGSGYYTVMGKSKTEAGIYSSTFQANNGTFAKSMRMSLPADLVRSLRLVKGMTAYIRKNTDGSFTVYPNKPPDHKGKRQ